MENSFRVIVRSAKTSTMVSVQGITGRIKKEIILNPETLNIIDLDRNINLKHCGKFKFKNGTVKKRGGD